MMLRIFTLLLVSLIAIGVSNAQDTPDPEPAPYLYYFSDAINAFVIERADGSDSRVLAKLPEDSSYSVTLDRGWSPSGKWFAWIAGDSYIMISLKSGGVASLDGGVQNFLVPTIETIEYVEWSPVKDYLLVISNIYQPTEIQGVVRIIDFTNERSEVAIVYSVNDIIFDYGLAWSQSPLWTSDGRYAKVEIKELLTDNELEQNFAIFDTENMSVETGHSISTGRDLYVGDNTGLFTSPNGKYIGLQRACVIVTSDGRLIEYPEHSYAFCNLNNRYNWSEDSGWVILTQSIFFAGGGRGIDANSILRVNEYGVSHQRELNASFNNAGFHVAQWLPERVVPHITQGAESSVIPTPLIKFTQETNTDSVFGTVSVAWSADSKHLASTSDILTIWRTDLERKSISREQQFNLGECKTYSGECYPEWSPDGKYVIVGDSFWDVEKDAFTLTSEDTPLPHWDYRRKLWVADSPDDQFRVRKTEGSERIEVVGQDSNRVVFMSGQSAYQLAWGLRGQRMVLISGSQIELWDTETWEPIALESMKDFRLVRVSPDGRWLVSMSLFYKTHIWDMTDGSLVARLNFHANDVDFSPDGRYLAAVKNRLVTIWDFEQVLAQGRR